MHESGRNNVRFVVSKFCSWDWQLQRAQTIIVKDFTCFVESEEFFFWLLDVGDHEAPTLPWITWVITLLLTWLNVSFLSTKSKILKPCVSTWHEGLSDTRLGWRAPSVYLFLRRSASDNHHHTLSLFYLPTGPFSLRRKENKLPKGKRAAELLNSGEEISAPFRHPPTPGHAPTEIHIEKKRNTI